MINNNHYIEPNPNVWSGRIDGTDAEFLRWHQVISCKSITTLENFENSVVFLGFTCDEGVKRNQGRLGAKEGPLALRKVLANLPVHFDDKINLVDIGDICCNNENLEEAQLQLGQALSVILEKGAFPILLGGGHEITYGHFSGIRKVTQKKIGIINIDAHFDIREPVLGIPNSGTGFYQIYQDSVQNNFEFHYLALGIQPISNTKALFKTAEKCGAQYVLAEDFYSQNLGKIKNQIQNFLDQVDSIYLTLDLDAFAAPYAPGVSALAFNGLVPDHTFLSVFKEIISHPKLQSVDVAELNPAFDIDNRTAKLAADLIFRVLQARK